MKVAKIFGRDCEIIYVKGLLKRGMNYGYYDYDDKKIYIDAGLIKKEKFETIFHEMGHAMFDRLGLRHNEALAAHEESLVE